MVDRLLGLGPVIGAEQLVDACLDLVGPLEVTGARRDELVAFVKKDGEVRCGTAAEKQEFERRVAGLLQLVVASREFQFA
jgi:hypothetical protein